MKIDATLYQPLRAREIRLLRILPTSDPNNPTEPIRCRLETFTLDTTPEYAALSYEWGGPDPETYIVDTFVNSRKLQLKVNLVLALIHIRPYMKAVEFIWIDALCINQNDLAERGQQVRLMTEIYQRALGVYAWLGRGRDDMKSQLGMHLIKELDTKARNTPSLAVADIEYWVADKLLDPNYREHWDGLTGLLERSYWSRVWITQEISVGRDVVLFCGLDISSLNRLRLIVNIIHRIDKRLVFNTAEAARQVVGVAAPFLKIERTIGAWQRQDTDENNRGLLRLMANASMTQCGDARDRVYALLGIAVPYPGLKLDVDYSRSIADIYLDVAQYIIRGSRRLDILSFCRRKFNPQFTLPSWVPDWMTYSDDFHVVIPPNNQGSACGSREAITSFPSDRTMLTARAIILGDIDRIVPFGEWRSIDGVQSLLRSLVDFAIDVLASQPSGPSNPVARAIPILYEVLFYNQLGIERTHKGWALEKFPHAIYSFDMEHNTNDDLYMISMLRATLSPGRCLFSLPLDGKTTMGLCADHARAGDKIAIVLGCRYPVVIHPTNGHYQVVGEALVHGYMGGDVVGKLPEVDITLV
jgi:Heterokaryon incompatibility protein (HET)